MPYALFRMSRVGAVLVGLAFFLLSGKSVPAAESAISGVVIDTAASAVAGPAFLVAVTPQTGYWTATSYAVVIELQDEAGERVALPRSVAGETGAAAGQTVFVAVRFDAPLQGSGVISVRVRLEHDGKIVAEDDRTAFALGAVAANAGAAGTSPAAQRLTGSIGTTSKFQARSSRTFAFSATQQLSADRSVFVDTTQSSLAGYGSSLVRFEAPGQRVEVGSFDADSDPLVLKGSSGIGASFVQTLPNNRSVRALYFQGDPTRENPYNAAALSYSTPVGADVLSITAGKVHAAGALDPFATVFLRDGVFAAAGLTLDKSAGLSYEARYGVISYRDEAAQADRTDRMVLFGVRFPTGAINWTADYVRAGTFYPDLTVPLVTPDREQIRTAFRVPIGKLALTGAAEGLRDGLDADFSTNKNIRWREDVALAYPLGTSSGLQLRVVNSIGHTDGVSAGFSGVDDSRFGYFIRRGSYAATVDIGSVNTRSSAGTTLHSIRNSFTLAREVSDGFGFSTGFTVNNRQSGDANLTEIEGSGSSGISYTHSIFSFTASAERALTRPFFGVAGVPTTSLDYSLRVRPLPAFPFGTLLTLGALHGTTRTTFGSLNVTRDF
jgi:hypothetical protein